MTDRKLFGTNATVNEFVQRLTEAEKLDGGWSKIYVDNETGLSWLEYTVDDRGFCKNLMLISPKLTTNELIDITFNSPCPDEVCAAATRLNLEERAYKKEFRLQLIERLNSFNISMLELTQKERFKTIIQASQLTDIVNKREIVGKHFSEIQKDAEFFNTVADKAQEILNMLK